MQKILLFFFFCLCGCTSTIPLTITTGAFPNTDALNRPLPVVLRIYQLSDPANFQQSSFTDLYLHDAFSLGASLLSKQAQVLLPNSQYHLNLKYLKKANDLGFMLLARENNHVWQLLVPIQKTVFGTIFKIKININHNQFISQKSR